MPIEGTDISPENPASINPGGSRFKTVNNAPLQNLPYPNNVKALDAVAGLDSLGRPNVGRAGRPFDEEVAQAYLDALESGEPLQAAVEIAETTTKQLKGWVDRNPTFAGQVALARMAGAHSFADKVGIVAKKVEDGDLEPNAGRVAMDGYKWIASKFAPRAYGDRLELLVDSKQSGPDLSAVPLEVLQQMEKLLSAHGLGPDFKPLKDDIVDAEFREVPV